MGLMAMDGGGKDFEPISEGVHLAVCYGLYDLGTSYQEGAYPGDRHQVLVIWEIPGERINIDGQDLPRAISKRYTLSLGEKSNLRKDLTAWRGVAFTDEQLKGFDLKNVLGKSCQLQIIHKPNAQGYPRAKIAAIMALPKGTRGPADTENPLAFYSFEDGGAIPPTTSEWVKAELMKSHEWAALANASGAPATAAADDSDIPF